MRPLRSAGRAAAAPSTKLSAPFPFAGGSILSFELTPDGRWVVYVGDQ